MSSNNGNHASVKRALLKDKSIPEGLAALDTLCAMGAQCPAVQGSPVAGQLLSTLKDAVSHAHVSMNKRLALIQALLAATENLKADFAAVKVALGSYETSVDVLADGDAALINQAGCQARGQKAPPAQLGNVTGVTSKPGKQAKEAILRWPQVSGATSYAIELNFSPESPSGPWSAMPSASRRRRVVKGPAPGAQLLARVAAVSGDGTQSAWSHEVLVTVL